MSEHRRPRSRPGQAASKPAVKGGERASPAKHRPVRTVEELLQANVETIRRLDVKALKPQSLTDRLAAKIAGFAGSPPFIWIHVAWFTTWILVNTVAPVHHFDPFPFTFLTLVVSLEAIFLSAFILMSQAVSAGLSERRNQLDLQINLLTEQENTKMLKLLVGIGRHLGVKGFDDPDLRLLEEETRPEQLAQQLDRSAEADQDHDGEDDGEKDDGEDKGPHARSAR